VDVAIEAQATMNSLFKLHLRISRNRQPHYDHLHRQLAIAELAIQLFIVPNHEPLISRSAIASAHNI
jgi:hypothetical protein